MSQIFELIPKVMADIGAVTKDRKNEQQGYMFRGIEDMYKAAHPALVRHGIFCCPQVLERISDDRISGTGKPAIRVSLKVSHRFYATDGSFVEVITWGEGIDSSDKGTNKAMSAAMKYAFIELFSIPTSDIEDSDRVSPESGEPGRASLAKPVTLTRPTPVPSPEVAVVVRTPEEAPDGSLPLTPSDGGEPQIQEEPAYITTRQKQYLSRRFRESLRADLEPQADELRHQALYAMSLSALFNSRFLDAGGNPTSDFILVSEYETCGKALVKAAKSL